MQSFCIQNYTYKLFIMAPIFGYSKQNKLEHKYIIIIIIVMVRMVCRWKYTQSLANNMTLT